MLSPSENLLRIIRFQSADHVPFDLEGVVRVEHRDARFYAGNGDPFATDWTDRWGVRFRREDPRLEGYPVSHPLHDFTNMDAYQWPTGNDREVLATIRRRLAGVDRGKVLIMSRNPGFMFVRSWLLVGMNELLSGMLLAPGKVEFVLDRIADYQIAIAKQVIPLGVDIFHFGDDAGMTKSLMMRPALWRRFIKPRLRRVIEVYRDAGCLVLMHCCGCIMEIAEDIMDLGVDILNPIQATANDLLTLRRMTQGRMALYGGIDAHQLMTQDTGAVAELTDSILSILATNGGYVAGPDQVLPFPKENLETVKERVRQFDPSA